MCHEQFFSIGLQRIAVILAAHPGTCLSQHSQHTWICGTRGGCSHPSQCRCSLCGYNLFQYLLNNPAGILETTSQAPIFFFSSDMRIFQPTSRSAQECTADLYKTGPSCGEETHKSCTSIWQYSCFEVLLKYNTANPESTLARSYRTLASSFLGMQIEITSW